MWSDSLHDKDFTARLLRHIETDGAKYGTASRMKGMVTLAAEVKSREAHHVLYCSSSCSH